MGRPVPRAMGFHRLASHKGGVLAFEVRLRMPDAPVPAGGPAKPVPKPDSNPTSVREPSPTRPPDKPTPDRPERPMSIAEDEEPEISGE